MIEIFRFQEKSKLNNEQLCNDVQEMLQQSLIKKIQKLNANAISSQLNTVFILAKQRAFDEVWNSKRIFIEKLISLLLISLKKN